MEIPRWVRLLDGRRFGGPGMSRREMQVIEAFCLGCGVIVIALSFIVVSNAAVRVLRTCGLVALMCVGLVRMHIRLGDRYKLWPGAADAPSVLQRTWRTKTAEYACLFIVGILGTAIIYWLVF